ncbi:hypothetical protein Hypma_014588 [Hypsizygus marmoreus]|uniref:Uncharacterized protein n=1 Tax=Hypsizygus marmoreus TaxID=39966 RepID=A0A369JHG4_HYPMA|nr:hypothetical protein Hypma_014588 [Hypsizygus marmoreus]
MRNLLSEIDSLPRYSYRSPMCICYATTTPASVTRSPNLTSSQLPPAVLAIFPTDHEARVLVFISHFAEKVAHTSMTAAATPHHASSLNRAQASPTRILCTTHA